MGGMQRYGPTERAVTLWGHEIACLWPFGDMKLSNYIDNVLCALALPRNRNHQNPLPFVTFPHFSVVWRHLLLPAVDHRARGAVRVGAVPLPGQQRVEVHQVLVAEQRFDVWKRSPN